MTSLYPYLTFSGNCREAMGFYKSCIGGSLRMQPVGDSPMGNKLPGGLRDYILHATLTQGALVIMASDMVPDSGLVRGNSVSLTLNCSNETEIRDCYNKLAEGGQATHPLEYTFWGSLFGSLTDKYGNHWLLNYDKGEK
jgi:PhnB protein